MRVLGVDIPDNKKVGIALTYIFGVGPKVATDTIRSTGLDANKRAKELKTEDIAKIQKFLEENYHIEGELRQDIKQNIKRLKDIDSYRGHRHSSRLPVRGQRTRRNTRTVRGNVRQTVSSGKRKVELK